MKILIVSDTHGRDTNLEVLWEAPFDMLIHCGDVEGREFFIEAFAEVLVVLWPEITIFSVICQREEEITLGGKKILVTHGHLLS